MTASYSTTTADLSSTNLTNQTIASDAATALSAIVLGGKGWVGCDSVVTTNCVQSFQDASGTDITKARVANYKMEGTASIHLVHVYGVSDGITYSNEIVANLNR